MLVVSSADYVMVHAEDNIKSALRLISIMALAVDKPGFRFDRLSVKSYVTICVHTSVSKAVRSVNIWGTATAWELINDV